MRSVDPSSALKMYMESGQWEKCLELAEKQVSSSISVPDVWIITVGV